MATDTTKLEALGNIWEKDDMKLVYFNAETLADLLEFTFTRYGTGNISSASLNGSKISNSKARKLWTDLSSGKCWYDYADDSFHTKYIAQDVSVALIEKLRQMT